MSLKDNWTLEAFRHDRDVFTPSGLCSSCVSVFSPRLFEALSRLWQRDFGSAGKPYRAFQRPVRSIYDSWKSGCVWCKQIVDDMYTAMSVEAVAGSWGDNLVEFMNILDS
jgi:hypothetical protein